MATTRVLVVVHGIGDQTEFATLQQVVNLCLGAIGQPKGVSIGRLHSELRPHGNRHRSAWAELDPLPGLGFAEVFWADIGRRNENHVLEDTTRWVDTIVERLGVLDIEAGPTSWPPLDLDRARDVLNDVTLSIRLARLANRGLALLGVGSIELDKMLDRYLGDIQLFAEYSGPREHILDRFHRVMSAIESRAQTEGRDVEIHICGHSQGSVVAFMGLLEGYRYRLPWLNRVRSLMTIGSPIDKFLILWPNLFDQFVAPTSLGTAPREPIHWRNYADLGDPVGYELDTAAAYWPRVDPGLFAPGAPEERLFRRYLVPGKAHVDYWDDQPLFNEWLGHDVGIGRQPPPPGVRPPGSKTIPRLVAPWLPFLLPIAFAGAAAMAIRAGLETIVGEGTIGGRGLAAMALLILGSVALSRCRHVSRRLRWAISGTAIFAAGAAAMILAFGRSDSEAVVIFVLVGTAVQVAIDEIRPQRRRSP